MHNYIIPELFKTSKSLVEFPYLEYNNHMQDGSASPIKIFFRNKWVRLILILDVLVIIAIVAIAIYNSTKNAIITFTIAPIDATITVNGNSSYQNGSFQFRPGTYEVVISHDELDSKSFTIELEANSNAAITTFLTKDGSLDFYELNDNQSSYLMLSRIASSSDNQTTDHDTSAEAFITKFEKNYNLYQTELPINHTEYTIIDDKDTMVYDLTIRRASDKSSCIKYLCIEAIMILTNDKNLVNSMLEDAGFNLEDFEVEYKIY